MQIMLAFLLAIGVSTTKAVRGAPSSKEVAPVHTAARDQYFSSHQIVYERVVDSFSSPDSLPSLIELFAAETGASYGTSSETIEYCDPYPNCLTTHKSIVAHLATLSNTLADVHIEAMPFTRDSNTQYWDKKQGGFWMLNFVYAVPATLTAPGDHHGGIAHATSGFLTWELSDAGTLQQPLIKSLRLNYDQNDWERQLSSIQPDASKLMIESSGASASVRDNAAIQLKQAMSSFLLTVSSVRPHDDCATQIQSAGKELGCAWTDAFTNIFDSTSNAAFCEPSVMNTPTGCTYGQEAIRALLFPSTPTIYAVSLLPASDIIVSGGVATMRADWVSQDASGKASTHSQVMQMTLSDSTAEADAGKLSKMTIFLSSSGSKEVAMRYAETTPAGDPTKSTPAEDTATSSGADNNTIASDLVAQLSLEIIGKDDSAVKLTDVDEINKVLVRSKARVTPISYDGKPAHIRLLLKKDSLSTEEQKEMFNSFELGRGDVVRVVSAVPGREPFYNYNKGEGSLHTTDYTDDNKVEGQYPTLFHMFNREEALNATTCDICNTSVYAMFHTQVPRKLSGGKGQDEIMQILRGDSGWEWAAVDGSDAKPVRLMVRASPEQGWMVTYPGSTPHVGIVGGSLKNLPYWGVATIAGAASFDQVNQPQIQDPWHGVPLPVPFM